MLKKVTSVFKDFKSNLLEYRNNYRSEKFLKAYSQNDFEKYISKIDSFASYKQIKVSDHSIIFFLISEQKNDQIDQLLNMNGGKFKKQILDDSDNTNKLFPITFAVLNDLKNTISQLQENGDNIYKLHDEGNNLLHISAFFNKLNGVNTCIDKKFNLDQQNDQGNTALHLATIYGHNEIVSTLLENKANPLILNYQNFSPIHEATLYNQLESFKLLQPSLQAVRITQNKCDVVHLASQLENHFMLEYILNDGRALINIRDNETQQATPLHYAIGSQSYECSKFLIQSGASLNFQDSYKQTPLHLAVELQSLSLTQMLVEGGADAGILNSDGLSPIDIAISERNQTLVSYFRSIDRFIKYFR